MTNHDVVVWRDLLSSLREQRRHIHALIHLTREQTQVLAEADVERLAEITRQQAEHLDEIESIESRRRQTVQRLMQTAGVNADLPTLSDCIYLAPEHTARTLKWLQQELIRDVRTLQTLNERNRLLVSTAAETVNAWLAVVVTAACNQMSYQPHTAGVAVVLDTEV